MNWQTPLALTIVALTLFLLIRSTIRKKKSGACGGGCCDKKSPSDDTKPKFAPSQINKNQKTPLS